MSRYLAGAALAGLCLVGLASADPLDWDRLDWRLDRATLVSRYLFHDRQPTDPWQQYRSTLNAGATPSLADRDDFAALPPERQASQRQRAAELLEQARTTLVGYAGGLRDAMQRNEVNYVGDLMWETPGFAEAVTLALRRLDRAAVLDPTSAEIWYHLAYFSDLAGDRERAERARQGFLAAWDGLPADRREGWHLYRDQVILDRAWALREAGRFQECLDWLADHRDELSRTVVEPALAPWTEGLLIRALVHAERGEHHAATAILPQLPVLDLPSRTGAPLRTYVHVENQRTVYYQRFHQGESPTHNIRPEWQDTVQDPKALEHRSSDYLRRWVKAWSALARGQAPATVQENLGRIMTELEFQPRVARRWWQDQGLIYEQLGEYELAQVCWARAAVYRPFFIYYPLGQGHGVSRVHGLAATGQPYFLAYGTFFTSGSLWSYAANAALASQVEDDPHAQAMLRRVAGEALDACILRGFFAAEALAVRGRLSFLAEDYAAAEQDLATAWDQLADRGDAPADIALMLGLCRFNGEDWTGARPWLATFVEREPEAHVGWQSLGLCEGMLGHQEAAVAAMDRAVALQPDNATYLYNRGLIHYRARQLPLARRDFARAQELWPENAQIAQMVRVAGESTYYTLQMATEPVQLDLPEEQRRELTGLMDVAAAGGGGLADLVTGSPETRAAILQQLRKQYADDPGELNRTRLAQAALMADEPELAQATLAPLWPDRLSPPERRLLLYADRARGDLDRAEEIASGLDWAGQDEDVEILILAATILLDHDRRDLARPVVDRALALTPGSAILQEMARNLDQAP